MFWDVIHETRGSVRHVLRYVVLKLRFLSRLMTLPSICSLERRRLVQHSRTATLVSFT